MAYLRGERIWYKQAFDVLNGKREVMERHLGGAEHPLITQGIPDHAVKGLLVCSSWKKSKEIFTNEDGSYENLGELFQLIPRDALGAITHVQGYVTQIEVRRPPERGGGSSILYIDTVEGYKHAHLSAESSDFDFIHYDEPPPQKMFIANKRGLTDRNGKFWINATPVEELWVNDEFAPSVGTNIQVADAGLRFRKTDRGGERFIITASIYDNPFISDEGRAEFEASLSNEEKQCRLFGLPLNLAGLVYKEFICDLHVLTGVPAGWQDYHLPPKNYTVRVAWDVHDAIPQAILFVATAPSGEAFVYDEMFYDKLIKPNAELLKEKLTGRFCADYLIDPRAVIESPVTGESILDELMEYDLYFDKGSKDMDLGISRVRERLKERRANGMPTIWVSPNCQQFLFEILRYAYNPRTMRPVDKDDHIMEDFRRLVLNGLDYVEPPKDTDYLRPVRSFSQSEDQVKERQTARPEGERSARDHRSPDELASSHRHV